MINPGDPIPVTQQPWIVPIFDRKINPINYRFTIKKRTQAIIPLCE